MGAFSDFIWNRMERPPPTEAEMKTVGAWLLGADHTDGLPKIIWHNCDQDTLDMVLHMSGLHYCHIPEKILEDVPGSMKDYILRHLENPEDLARKFLDVSETEFRGTGLDAYDVPSPAEGDGTEIDSSENSLMQLMTATLPKGDWRTKVTLSFSPAGIAQRLMPIYNFNQQYWGNQRMETWLKALEFPTAWKEKLLRMALDPTQQEAVCKASIAFQSSQVTCAARWHILGKAEQHSAVCGAGGCTDLCVIKICSGSAKTTQTGAPNVAALTNKFRPMLVCTDHKHNSFELPPRQEGARAPKCMTYIYLDVWYMEKILQWHYQQEWSTEEIVEELKKPKYKLELSLIYRWRAAQGVINPGMWDFPQDLDREIQDISQEIQREMTENVKKKANARIKEMRENALKVQDTSKVVYQSTTGKKRLSLMTGSEVELFKRQKGDKTPGLGTHVDSSRGYPSDRTTSPVPYTSWETTNPTHAVLSQGKGGKGKSGKGKGKRSSKGKSKGKTYARDSWSW